MQINNYDYNYDYDYSKIFIISCNMFILYGASNSVLRINTLFKFAYLQLTGFEHLRLYYPL